MVRPVNKVYHTSFVAKVTQMAVGLQSLCNREFFGGILCSVYGFFLICFGHRTESDIFFSLLFIFHLHACTYC